MRLRGAVKMYKYYKKNIILVIASIFLFSSFFSFLPTKASANIDLNLDSYILVDAQSGKVLLEKNADIELGIASMSKMMSEYLVLEAINNNRLSWDQPIPISPWVSNLSQDPSTSNVLLTVDGVYTVRDLYESVAIESANASTMALGEYIAGTYANFIKLMNDKAVELKLDKYHFVNSTGLPNRLYRGHHAEGTDPEDENRMSARATAQLAFHLINDFPEVLETSKIPMKYFQGGLVTDKTVGECLNTWECMTNWNRMLQGFPHYYEGVDGLKTGFTNLAKNTFTGTAERNGIRLISVVMGAETRDDRFIETAKLLDYGFNNFELLAIRESLELPVVLGKKKETVIAPTEDLTFLIKAGEKELYSASFEIDPEVVDKDGNLVAPLEEGQVVGYLTYEYSGDSKFTYLAEEGYIKERVPVVATETIEKAGWFSLTLRAIGGFFSGIWTSVSTTVKGIFS